MQGAKVHIERSDSGWVDRARAYDVIINQELRGKLKRGDQTEIDVRPGQQSIYLKIDWCRSRILRVDVEPGSSVWLRCQPRNPLTAIYGITFGRKNYVRLEITKPPTTT